MGFGAACVLFQGVFTPNPGDIIILLATAVPPFGNYYAQKARKYVSSIHIMFIRSVITGFVFFLLAWIFEGVPSFSVIQLSFPLLLINGILLCGVAKVLWIEGIHRLAITKAISLASTTPAWTLFFAYLFLHEIPTVWQLVGIVPLISGVWLLTRPRDHRSVGASE